MFPEGSPTRLSPSSFLVYPVRGEFLLPLPQIPRFFFLGGIRAFFSLQKVGFRDYQAASGSFCKMSKAAGDRKKEKGKITNSIEEGKVVLGIKAEGIV